MESTNADGHLMVNDAAEEFENKILNKQVFDADKNPMTLHDPYDELIYPLPLIVPKNGPQNERRDSFFRCLSYGLYHKHSRYKELRQQLLLQFVFILFLNEDVCTLDQFLNKDSADLIIRDEGLHHPAIQMWVYRMSVSSPAKKYPRDVYQWVKRDKEAFCKSAQLFVEFNRMEGRLSCKYTFAYLMADKYGLHIRFYEHIQKSEQDFGKVQSSGWIHPPASLVNETVPPAELTTPRDLEQAKAEEGTIRKQGYSLTLFYAHRRFKLLQPLLRKSNAGKQLSQAQRDRLLQAGMKHMPKYVADYVLRVYADDAIEGPTNTVVGHFELPRLKGGKVHTHVLDPQCLQPDRVFQIYPGQPRVRTFSFPEGEGLFLYVMNDEKQAKLLSFLKRDSDYLYFPLPDWAKKLAVLVTKTEADADTAIRNELKVTIIKQ